MKKITKTDINVMTKEKYHKEPKEEKNMEEYIKKEKKINKKKLIILIISVLLIILAIITFALYCKNENFRNWTDKNILQKEVIQGNTISIEFDGENNSNVYAFDKYIVTLENKILKIYNNLGTEEAKISTEINDPIFDAEGKYLAIGEKNGDSIYLLKGKQMLWNTNVEGKISQIEINENGYVGVVISDISYKNVINIYNLEGKILLTTYVANNNVEDISISKNNQYLAIAELDISGVLIQSSIKVIDIEKAKTEPQNSIINTFTADVGKLITNIEYQNQERLLCAYNDSIDIIEGNNNQRILELVNSKITFASIELKNNMVTIEERQTGEYVSNSYVNITNVITNKVKNYTTEEIAKEIYTYGNVIAMNLGTELHMINTNGWLMKRYISTQEINKVVISNKIAGVIYRDKIEIIDL